MSLLNRALRVARANVNHCLAAAEDPEIVLQQRLKAMEQALIALRQGVAQGIAAQKQTEREAAQCELIAANWQQRGRVALSQGDETGARDALTRRYRYARRGIALQERLTEQQACIQRLREHLRDLEQQLREAKSQQSLLVARARSAEAARKIDELRAFERMEEKAAADAEIAAMRAQQSTQCN